MRRKSQLAEVMLRFFILLLISAPVFADNIVADCRLLRENGELIMTLPGRQCEFLENGDFLSLGEKMLRRFGSEGEMIWEYPVETYRSRFVLSSDKKKILIVVTKKEVSTLIVLDLEGKLLHQAVKNLIVSDFGDTPEGEYFINVYKDGIYFLDESLENVTSTKKIKIHPEHSIHALKFTGPGKYLYLLRSEKTITVEEYDEKSGKILFHFPPKPSKSFYFPFGGSVCVQNGQVLVNHSMSGLYVVSKKSGQLENYLVSSHFDTDRFNPPIHVFRKDLTEFFKGWKF
jgi:hypothetical protein